MSLVEEYLGIIIDKGRDAQIPEKGMSLLTAKGAYKKPWEDSPQQGYARAATAYCFGDYDFAQRIYDYVSKGWFVNASPVLSTAEEILWPHYSKEEFQEAGDWLEENVQPDGLPISCFLSYIPDTKEGLVATRSETANLSMVGGGIGIHPAMRSPDEKSTGVMAHLKGYDADALSYKQSKSRRGSVAAYLNVDHPEIIPFIKTRDPIEGDIGSKCFNINNAVNITDKFMESVIKGEDYELVDPKHGPTGNFLDARYVFELMCEMRHQTGEPYMNFIDTVNRDRNPWITKATYNVVQSNLCTEITLMTSAKRTAVCCLSSLNLAKYDEWKDTNIVQDLVRYLDNVIEYFIRLAPKELSRAVHSASQERAIGIGTLGWHSYLQKNSIPFESGGFNSAVQHTNLIYSDIEAKAIAGSQILAKERGCPEDCLGGGMRNSHLIAIAPNASSADMVLESPGIEPWASNCFTAEGRSGVFLVKNKYLEALLEEKGQNTADVWKSIHEHDGSVQHLAILTENEKLIFKTAREIDPMWIIELASHRQKHIDQGQSINLFGDNTWTKQYFADIIIMAWYKGLKSLYYMRGKKAENKTTSERVTQPLNRVELADPTTCLGCDG